MNPKAQGVRLVVIATALAGAGAAPPVPPEPVPVLVVDRPAQPHGAAVLLLAGGYANDADWTTPGSVDLNGEPARLTISGEPHADAPALAAALTNAGFVVARYATAARPFPESVEVARQALAGTRALAGVDRVYLLGHSLGATRAALVADDGVEGFVFLAGAYLSKTTTPPRALAEAAAGAPGSDLDGDGALSGWERAAAGLVASEEPTFLYGLDWPIDRLAGLGKPVLAVFGGLDPVSVHGASVAGLPDARVEYLPGLGHQLGPEEVSEPWPLVGPMSPAVAGRAAAWLAETDARRRSEGAESLP